MKILALIPSRGGSKRIPRKNIKDFMGKPIIAWSIEIAIKSGIFDEVMVSTEDMEIAKISIKYGAVIPFMRSHKNASDLAGTEEVILEVLNNYEKLNKKFDIICCIYPTAPLITVDRLIEAKNKMLQEHYDTVFPVIRYGYPIQKALKISNKNIQMVWPEYDEARTQDLETYFHDTGQYYWLCVKKFKIHNQIFSSNSGFIELSEIEAQDIDNIDDWKIAELKFQMLNNIG